MASILKTNPVESKGIVVFIIGLSNGKTIPQMIPAHQVGVEDKLMVDLSFMVGEPLVPPRAIPSGVFLYPKAGGVRGEFDTKTLNPETDLIDVDRLISDVMNKAPRVVVVPRPPEVCGPTRMIAVTQKWMKIDGVGTVWYWCGYDPKDQEWLIPVGQ